VIAPLSPLPRKPQAVFWDEMRLSHLKRKTGWQSHPRFQVDMVLSLTFRIVPPKRKIKEANFFSLH